MICAAAPVTERNIKMDFAFHYHAVKTIARKAGFNEPDAQQIAYFSQFVDDYNIYNHRDIKFPTDGKYDEDRYDFISDIGGLNPVTTGFWSWDDYVTLMTDDTRKFTVSPFHFIPAIPNPDGQTAATTSPAKIGDESVISNLLDKAKTDYLNTRAGDSGITPARALMEIGMYLHTFADTYAHQNFSGFNDECNRWEVLSVTSHAFNKDIEDETDTAAKMLSDKTISLSDTVKSVDYEIVSDCMNALIKGAATPPAVEQTEPFKAKITDDLRIGGWWGWNWLVDAATGKPYAARMPLGHGVLAHLPDYTHLEFTIKRVSDGFVYTRSNIDEFVAASHEIFDYLASCANPARPCQWTPDFELKLRAAFMFDISNEKNEWAQIEKLNKRWGLVFGAPDEKYQYKYQRRAVFGGAIKGHKGDEGVIYSDCGSALSKPDDEYWYNIFAEDVLIALYGKIARS
jgi:hypothetical protein